MAHTTEIMVNGILTQVTEFDHSAQEIDDAVDALGGAKTPQEALANLGAGVRPNLLDNAIFIGGGSQKSGGQLPVNQREKTSYSENGYCIDRWRIGSFGTLTIAADYIEFVSSDTTGRNLEQPSNDLPPGIYTLSFIVANGGGGHVLCGHDGGYSSADIDGDQKQMVSFTFTKIDSAPVITYLQTANKAVKVYAAKLEEGSTQTLAYQDEDGAWQLLPQPKSDYSTQLAKCQRYYIRFKAGSYIGRATSANSAQFIIPIPVQMRTTPVLSDTLGSNWRLQDADGTYKNLTGVKIYSGGVNSSYVTLYAESESLFTAGAMYTLSRLSSAGDWSLSCEL